MALKQNIDTLQSVPPQLQQLKQWLCYTLEKRPNSEKYGKPPVDPQTGHKISWTDPKNFLSFDSAVAALKANVPKNLAGIGLVFTGEEPYSGVDIDGCLTPNGTPSLDTVVPIVSRLNTYTEISPSGIGLRIIGCGKLANNDAGGRCDPYEAYSAKRFLTITGVVFDGRTEIREFSADLNWFRQTYAKSQPKQPPVSPPSKPLALTSSSDTDLLKKILVAKNGDKARRLLHGDTSLHGGDHSSADQALCTLLAGYTRDPHQIDRIFRSSKLMRPKWDESRGAMTYGEKTIATALSTNPGMTSTRLDRAEVSSPPSPPPKRLSQIQTISATDLQNKQLPEPKWAVPSLIPEGLTVLAGRPKRGKSWLALGLSLAVASGGYALGKIKVTQGGALFFGLEDNERRLKDRLTVLTANSSTPLPNSLEVSTQLAAISSQTMDDLRWWLDANKHTRLVVIDTLQKITPACKGRDIYAEMYTVLGSLQKLSIDHGIAIVVNHHTTKAKTDSALDAVHGTTAITGVADSILVLGTGKGGASAILHTTGRDIESQELALNFDGGVWTIIGDASSVTLSPQRKAVLDLLQQRPMSPSDIATALSMKLGTVNKLLFTMRGDGQITQEERGVYKLPGI